MLERKADTSGCSPFVFCNTLSSMSAPNSEVSHPLRANCPIDGTACTEKREGTPYWICKACGAWFQCPAPPKSYEGPHEASREGGSAGDEASESDIQANFALARAMFTGWSKWQKAPLQSSAEEKPKTLDIGAKYPLLARGLSVLGCEAEAIDAIDETEDFGAKLGVKVHRLDVEKFDADEFVAKHGKYKLVSMVHVFEHMHEPVRMVRVLRQIVTDDGLVFLRFPDHEVPGFERDLTANHYTIHPFFHTLGSVLEAIVRAGSFFRVAETYTFVPGQRDMILRPATSHPVVYAGMIAKNEQRDLPHALRSLRGVLDGLVFVDTGSKDNTVAIAHREARVVHYETYLGSSVQDEKGNWLLEHFGDARNRAVDWVERNCKEYVDYFLWFDADDQLKNPSNLKRALLFDNDVVGVTIRDGNTEWIHHRLWKVGRGVRFVGACHEYPHFPGLHAVTHPEIVIQHHGDPSGGETSNARNLRILTKEVERQRREGKLEPRTLFYLANTHRDGGRDKEASDAYRERVEMGYAGHRDEYLFALLYGGRCLDTAGQKEESREWLLKGFSKASDWCEFAMELATQDYRARRYQRCIGWCNIAYAPDRIPPTHLWREANRYTDQPLRYISWCYEHMGDIGQALEWARRASKHVPSDRDWNARIARLEKEPGVSVLAHARGSAGFGAEPHREDLPLVLHRPGAIGDVLMTLNLVPLLREKWGTGQKITYVCDEKIVNLLAPLFSQLGITAQSHMPKAYAERYNLIGYPLDKGYPERPIHDHLIRLFAKEMGLELKGDKLPQAVFNAPILSERIEPTQDFVTIQTKTGWSVYKEWPIERWKRVVEWLGDRHISVVQVGAGNDPPIPGVLVYRELMGNMTQCIAAVSHALLHIGLDSFANHLTHYMWKMPEASQRDWGYLELRQTPGVILWGSTQPTASGYAENTNLWAELSCSPCFREDPKVSTMPRGPCPNPEGQTCDKPQHRCMSDISEDMVIAAIRDKLDGKRHLT